MPNHPPKALPESDTHRILVREASCGADTSMDRLMDRHLPGLLAFVRARMGPRLGAREETLDLAQSTCRELLEELQRKDYGDEADFKRWLYRAAENKIRDRVRYYGRLKRDVQRERPLAEYRERELALYARGVAGFFTPSHEAGAKEELQLLEQALARLPEEYREVILLSRVVELDRKRVAHQMERTESAVGNLLFRALARLERLMREQPGSTPS